MATKVQVSHEKFLTEAFNGYADAKSLADAVGMKEPSVIARCKRYIDEFGSDPNAKDGVKALEKYTVAGGRSKFTAAQFTALFNHK